MRPYWKGYLKLALVSCPIAVHAACSTAERIALRQINKATGNRLRQQLIDEETREPVAPEHKGRGYEVAKGQYLVVEDAELEAIEIESTHTIEIDSFVPRAQIDQRFFDSPYYVMPSEPVGQEAFAVIREAMRGKRMVALGRLVLSKRERVIALEPALASCPCRSCAAVGPPRQDTRDVAAGRAFVGNQSRVGLDRFDPQHLSHWSLTTRARYCAFSFGQIGHERTM